MNFTPLAFRTSRNYTLSRIISTVYPSLAPSSSSLKPSLGIVFPLRPSTIVSQSILSAFIWEPFHRLSALISLHEIFGPIVWAVPKKKTSHSKKRMRMATKGLKNLTSTVECRACGKLKRMHHLCLHCYKQLKHQMKGWQLLE